MRPPLLYTVRDLLLILSGCFAAIAFAKASDEWLFISIACGLLSFLVYIAMIRARCASAVSALPCVLLFVAMAIGLVVANKVRDASIRLEAQSRLERIGGALLEYADNQADRRLPPQALRDVTGKPLLSWRVAILPYLGEKELYDKFNLREPWNSPQNRGLIPLMPQVYALPHGSVIPDSAGMTHFQVFLGKDTAFECPMGCSVTRDFPAGLSSTILLAEARRPVVWTKPDDMEFPLGSPLPELGFVDSDRYSILFPAPTTHYVLWGDGSVESLSSSELETNEIAIKNGAVSRNGNTPRWRYYR